MKLEINYKLLRIIMVISVIVLAIILNIKVFGRGEIVHKFNFKSNICVPKDQDFNYNILDVCGDIHVDGRVIGNIASINSDVYIDGEVNGNVICLFGKIHKGNNAKIIGKTLQLDSDKRNFIIKNNKVFSKNNLLYIIFGIIVCESLYFVNIKERVKVADNIENRLKEKFRYGYVTEISCFIVLIILIFALLGIQFAPAIALIPLIALGAFFMYLLGFVSLMIYCGMKINLRFNIKVPYHIYICLFIILYSFIRNVQYFGLIIGVFFIIPLSIGAIYVEYLHNCLNKLNYEDDKIKSI